MKPIIAAFLIKEETPEATDLHMRIIHQSMALDEIGILVDENVVYDDNGHKRKEVDFYYTEEALEYLELMLSANKEMRKFTRRVFRKIGMEG